MKRNGRNIFKNKNIINKTNITTTPNIMTRINMYLNTKLLMTALSDTKNADKPANGEKHYIQHTELQDEQSNRTQEKTQQRDKIMEKCDKHIGQIPSSQNKYGFGRNILYQNITTLGQQWRKDIKQRYMKQSIVLP